MLAWRPIALAGFWELALSVALAVVVFTARPERQQNRFLALFLLVNGLWHGSAEGFRMVLNDARDVAALGSVIFGLIVPAHVLYLLFLSTIDSPLSRPLAKPLVRWTLGLVALVALGSAIAAPDLWFRGLLPWRHVGGLQYDITAFTEWVFYAAIGVFLYSLAVGITAFRRAAGPLERRQMGFYVAAFAIHDGFQVTWLLILNLAINTQAAGALLEPFYFALPALMTTVLATLLAYGILQAQLFDIDLKIKFALSKSTVVALFAGLVFVASELVEQLLGVDQLVPAILAAGVIALAMRPLVRVGERVADRVMPGVEDSIEYRDERKREVYSAALEGAASDGELTSKERDMLDRLATTLGLDEEEARAMEHKVVAAQGLV